MEKRYDHANKVLDGEVGTELNADVKSGSDPLMGCQLGLPKCSHCQEVTKAEDLKGLKIRTIPNKVFVAAINTMGANATPMNFGEVYTSLQVGVLDGYEHTAATTLSFKFNEVACCMALTRHLMDPTMLVFSMAEWKKLNATEQDVVMKAAKSAAEHVRSLATTAKVNHLLHSRSSA